MAISVETLAAAMAYTTQTVEGGGAIKGKNCVISSITEITGGNHVVFQWTLDNGTVQTGSMDVMNGAKGDKGDQGDDYVLTAQDKTEIANIVLGSLTVAESQEV